MEYIEAPDALKGKNPFVAIPQMKDERSSLLIHRGQTGYLVMNRYPYNAGHLLAIPYREVGDLEELSEAERNELMELIVKAKRILQQALQPHAFNVGFNLGSGAGAGIPSHLHAHIVPRWNGDTNFMPVIGETRVLPTSMEAMWERLRSVSDELYPVDPPASE